MSKNSRPQYALRCIDHRVGGSRGDHSLGGRPRSRLRRRLPPNLCMRFLALSLSLSTYTYHAWPGACLFLQYKHRLSHVDLCMRASAAGPSVSEPTCPPPPDQVIIIITTSIIITIILLLLILRSPLAPRPHADRVLMSPPASAAPPTVAAKAKEG